MIWNDITKGSYKNKVHSDLDKGQSLGGTIAVPFTLKGNESKTIKLRFSWFVPDSKLRYGDDGEKACSDSNCCWPTTDNPAYTIL